MWFYVLKQKQSLLTQGAAIPDTSNTSVCLIEPAMPCDSTTIYVNCCYVRHNFLHLNLLLDWNCTSTAIPNATFSAFVISKRPHGECCTFRFGDTCVEFQGCCSSVIKRQSVLLLLFQWLWNVTIQYITLLYALLLKNYDKTYVNDLCLQHSNTIFVVV